MKLTKYQHACFVVEKEGTTIVVDLGNFSRDFIPPRHVDAIVITHEHEDHLDEKRVMSLLKSHPNAQIIGHETITGRFTDNQTIAVKVGEVYQVGSMSLQFFGGEHALIAEGMPSLANLGVLIDNHLYYPGDSFAAPESIQVTELALPVSAPWLKISEATNFLARIRPQFAFPTHDAILSDDGKRVVDRLIGIVAASQSTTYKRLDSSSIEL